MKKDKIIKIYREKQSDDGLLKEYIHGKNGIKAFVRSLKIAESISQEAIEDGSVIECTINGRDIRCGDYIEFKNKVYRLSILDPFDFKSKRDIKFQAKATNEKEYIGEVYVDVL